MDDRLALIVLALYWAAYFVVHSLLASLSVKGAVARRRPRLMPAYRLVYNALALILALPPLYWLWRYPGDVLWTWDGPLQWVSHGLAIAVLVGFGLTLRGYDGMEFLGLRQWRSHDARVADQESFKLSPLHRFVRHPWYFLALVLIWSRDMTAALGVTAVAATLYFWLGSRLEERKLLQYHGELYREYRREVPALLPSPWRWLSGEEARRLASGKRE